MTIENVMDRIKREVNCHKKELEKVIKKKENFEKDESQEIESMLNMLRGIKLQAKIEQLEVLLLVCGDPDIKMESEHASYDTCDSVLDAPSSYSETIGEMERQMEKNELFVKSAKSSFVESFNDLIMAGFTKEQIIALLN